MVIVSHEQKKEQMFERNNKGKNEVKTFEFIIESQERCFTNQIIKQQAIDIFERFTILLLMNDYDTKIVDIVNTYLISLKDKKK